MFPQSSVSPSPTIPPHFLLLKGVKQFWKETWRTYCHEAFATRHHLLLTKHTDTQHTKKTTLGFGGRKCYSTVDSVTEEPPNDESIHTYREYIPLSTLILSLTLRRLMTSNRTSSFSSRPPLSMVACRHGYGITQYSIIDVWGYDIQTVRYYVGKDFVLQAGVQSQSLLVAVNTN